MASLVSLPGPSAGPPGRHAAPVPLVLLAELTPQGRLLVQMHKGGDGERGGVGEEDRLTQYQRLSDDRRRDRHVHGIAYVPVQTAYDQALCGSDRRGRAKAFDSEARKRLQQCGSTGDEQNQTRYPKRQPIRERLSQAPAR